LPSSQFPHDNADSPESQLIGGPIQEYPDKVAAANPITYVGQNNPPFLIMHGDQDPIVPFHQSQVLYEALQAAGSEVSFQPVTGAGHGGEGFRDSAVLQTVVDFFTRHLS
jgi:dipeptidyl aminopeptidase/acylaminoacyl peptidase